jgi:membrane-bound lytic murein transglycosylase D
LLQSQLDEETLKNTYTYNIEGKYNSVVLANELVMDISEFNRLNPNFDRLVPLEGGYDLRLPKAKMEVFQANQFILLRQSLMATLNSAGTIGTGYPEAKPKPVQTTSTTRKKK